MAEGVLDFDFAKMHINLKHGIFAAVIVGIIFISGCVQRDLPPNYVVEENKTDQKSFGSDYRSSEPPIEQLCATVKYPDDCNQIPYEKGREVCKKCKNISGEQTVAQPNENFIVANPLDLSQIGRISKFRSCVGHDYSGLNSEGEVEELRSMKHYVEPLQQLQGSKDSVKIFAPFDGKVREVEESPPGTQLYISSDAANEWNFIFFHTSPLPEIKEGTRVKAGQLLGYAHEGAIPNFDVGLKKFSWREQVFDSQFLHMAPSVLAEYETKGVTAENAIIPKETRDNNPCPIREIKDGEEFFEQWDADEYVAVQQ